MAGFTALLIALPLYYMGLPEPLIHDAAATIDFVVEARLVILASATLADPIIIHCLLVFLPSLSHFVKKAQPDSGWISGLALFAGLVVITLVRVGDALQCAAAKGTKSIVGLFKAAHRGPG